MDLNREERTKNALEFLKNKMNIDMAEFSPEKSRLVVDELNTRLDKLIEEEKKKNELLTQEIYTERNRIMELTQQLYG